jgi:hypothetical protein
MDVDQIPDIPVLIKKLVAEPSSKTIAERSVSPSATNVIDAVKDAKRWIENVIDREWLPEKLDPLCIDREFEGTGTIRHEWKKAGCSLKVIQTKNSFTLVIRLEAEKNARPSKEYRLSSYRKICLQVLAKTGERRTGQGKIVPIPEFNKKIVSYSFDPLKTSITNVNDVLSGKPIMTATDSSILTGTESEINEQINKMEADWFNSPLAFEYWFRHIYWVADNEQIIIYFKKVLPSATVVLQDIHVSASSDTKWFK